MTKFLASCRQVKAVEVERETESCVWIQGQRLNKETEYSSYHDTPEQAKEALIARAKRNFDVAEERMKYAQKELAIAHNVELPNR